MGFEDIEGVKRYANFRKTGVLKSLKKELLQLLSNYENAEGHGRDKYCGKKSYHAMADAKYLSAIAEIRRIGLINSDSYIERLDSVVTRLKNHNLSKSSELACWGLGFDYGETPTDEPYLITTSFVAKGLVANNCPETQPLCKAALAWLNSYQWTVQAKTGKNDCEVVKLPCYNPKSQTLIYNAVAQWAGVLRWSQEKEVVDPSWDLDAIRDLILADYVEPVGWRYSPVSTRFDLLHLCYILDGLSMLCAMNDTEDKALKAVSFFLDGKGGFLDKFDLFNLQDSMKAVTRSYACSILPVGEFWVLRHHVEAKLWSLGELLGVLCNLARRGEYYRFWERVAHRTAFLLITELKKDQEETKYPRDMGHVINGLSTYVGLLNDKMFNGSA
jgi:hypothetical protein